MRNRRFVVVCFKARVKVVFALPAPRLDQKWVVLLLRRKQTLLRLIGGKLGRVKLDGAPSRLWRYLFRRYFRSAGGIIPALTAHRGACA